MLVASVCQYYQDMLVIGNGLHFDCLNHLICREKGRQRQEGVSWAKG